MMSREIQTVIDAEGNIVGRIPLHFAETEGRSIMAGAIEYQTDLGDTGLVMIGRITHMVQAGPPHKTLIYLDNGTMLRSGTAMETLHQRINDNLVAFATKEAEIQRLVNEPVARAMCAKS